MTSEPQFSLDDVDAELDDAEIVLACLDRGTPGMCDICREAEAAGTLAARPALQACAAARSEAPSG